MNSVHSQKVDDYRRLAIKKDLIELGVWTDSVENINTEIEQLKSIANHLLQDTVISQNLLGFRRKNTLMMGMLCKYEQELKKEYEFGKQEYDISRAKEHEKRRVRYIHLINELKYIIYNQLSKFRRS